jgi:hypothetical protein
MEVYAGVQGGEGAGGGWGARLFCIGWASLPQTLLFSAALLFRATLWLGSLLLLCSLVGLLRLCRCPFKDDVGF